MAVAKITLTLSPEEYAFTRRALTSYTAQQAAIAKDNVREGMQVRREAQQEASQGKFLLDAI